MTPEQREALIHDITERVVEKLTPLLDEWHEQFEQNFVDSLAEVFDGYFEDRISEYSIRKKER